MHSRTSTAPAAAPNSAGWSIEDTYKFIKDRPEIELIEIKNMKHHMEPEEIEFVTEKMITRLNIN